MKTSWTMAAVLAAAVIAGGTAARAGQREGGTGPAAPATAPAAVASDGATTTTEAATADAPGPATDPAASVAGSAADAPADPAAQQAALPPLPVNEMHPAFFLRDAGGTPVPDRATAFDLDRTCGECHDTAYIRANSAHHRRHVEVDCLTCHLRGGRDTVASLPYDEAGRIRMPMAPPSSASCGSCHGLVHEGPGALEVPPVLLAGDERGPTGGTLRTGEVYAPHLVSASFLNLVDKDAQDRPWDVHAARGLQCADCHFAANHPQKAKWAKRAPVHLKEDPRALALSAYLKRPDHRFRAAACVDCHDPSGVHDRLPYPERHMAALACQSCHTPALFAPALRSVDRTVVTAEGGPRMSFRGVEAAEFRAPNTWYVAGHRPFLGRDRAAADAGEGRFAPFNPVAEWAWVSGAEGRPVDPALVRRAFLDDAGAHRPEVVAALDGDRDGRLSDAELVLSGAAEALVRDRLIALGVDAPRIRGQVVAHPVRHGIVRGDRTAAACDSCHAPQSRFNEPVALADGPFPGGVVPVPAPDDAHALAGRSVRVEGDRLVLSGAVDAAGAYVLGHHRRSWTDMLGFGLFGFTVAAVAVHGGLRLAHARRRPRARHGASGRRVYMYGVYERIWHWTMAACVVALLITGLHIHFPSESGLLAFPAAVAIHNVAAALLILNAALSLFYHVTTGEIRQYLPHPDGFARRIVAQALYYTRGIFAGAAHPTAKSPDRKLNPLQQVTYAGLLNVLFPLQVITGILLWVGGVAPDLLAPIGGLSVVGPVHNLGSWLFLAFLVAHVYLTTTGHTPTANLRAMVGGWDTIDAEVER